MIKHVYLIKLKDPEKAREVADRLLTMREHVPAILDMEVGLDCKGDANSFDLCQICIFESEAAFEEFGNDPYHGEIREYVMAVSAETAKVDY